MTRSGEVYVVVAFLIVAVVLTVAVALCEVAGSADRRARRWRRESEQLGASPRSSRRAS